MCPSELLPRILRHAAVACLSLGLAAAVHAAASDDVQQLLLKGDYTGAIRTAESAQTAGQGDEDLTVLYVRALLTVGRYEDADLTAARAVTARPSSIRLRWIAREAALANGRTDAAGIQATQVGQLVRNQFANYRDPKNLLVFAEYALTVGSDPKQVLDNILMPVQRADPKMREVYLARGNLALEKHDFDLAAKAFDEGLKQAPDDPDLNYGKARAFATGDRKVMLAALQDALKANPKHVPSMLLAVEHSISAEDYDGALKQIEAIKAVNPWQPEAWAYATVIANLRNQPETETSARANALKYWATNPKVDWLIGKLLAEKYRFKEGSDYLRKALASGATFAPAKAELGSTLLRLGQEEEGWKIVTEVAAADPFDVEAFNLTTLRETLNQYAILKDENFVLRLTKTDAAIYGQEALAMLNEARTLLTKKYGIDIAKPTYVDVFGDQKDFAVRTFGVPDVAGFLGVCFGRVVTANGPAATVSSPANWRAVLWHEFTHVITLQLTQNKMPRWLSEGISVYEETKKDPSWGMRMTPRYREMILKGELTPVGSLSAAFLAPKNGEYLQFAYFESFLVVDFIAGKYGTDALQGILKDLGAGVEINRAIATHTQPMSALEKEFEAYAKDRAEKLAPGLIFEQPPAEVMARTAELQLQDWLARNPDNYFGMLARARQLVARRAWNDAKPLLERLVQLYPAQAGTGSAYPLLAATLRGLEDTAGERALLVKYSDLDDTATDAYARGLELAADAKDWATVKHLGERYLAVNPLVPLPHRFLARAAQATGDNASGIAANRVLLQLDPPNPADVHYQLATFLHRTGSPEARRQVLQALEEAPRYRDALQLLEEINLGAARAPTAP
jgi:Tfp pilus assembly protein PilF